VWVLSGGSAEATLNNPHNHARSACAHADYYDMVTTFDATASSEHLLPLLGMSSGPIARRSRTE
jgi:hypothetical protein